MVPHTGQPRVKPGFRGATAPNERAELCPLGDGGTIANSGGPGPPPYGAVLRPRTTLRPLPAREGLHRRGRLVRIAGSLTEAGEDQVRKVNPQNASPRLSGHLPIDRRGGCDPSPRTLNAQLAALALSRIYSRPTTGGSTQWGTRDPRDRAAPTGATVSYARGQPPVGE